MNCPECNKATGVVDSRLSAGAVRRRRACPCGHRFTTFEAIRPVAKACDAIPDVPPSRPARAAAADETHAAMWMAEAHQVMADSLERRLAMHHTVTEPSARQVLWGIHCAHLDAVQHLTDVARKEAAHAD